VSTRPGLLRVLLDTLSWLGGWVIISKQAGILFDPPAQVNETLVWLAAAMIGVPGVAQVLLARFGNGAGTAGSPSSPPPPASPSSSSGAPSRAGDLA
jgi:hypothetical protein